MKTLIAILTAAILCPLQAQWSGILEPKQTNAGIHKHGNQYFWMEGMKLFSSDNGLLFEIPATQSSNSRFGMSFSDEGHGLLVVEYTRIFAEIDLLYATNDTGKTWTMVTYPIPGQPINAFESVSVTQKTPEAWLCNNSSGLWYSQNSGKDWNNILAFADSVQASLIWSGSPDEIVLSRNSGPFTFDGNDSLLLFLKYNLKTGSADTFFKDALTLLRNDSNLGSYHRLGKILKTKTGRWYILFHEFIPACGSMYNGSVLLYSDDNGKTWHKIKLKLGNDIYEEPRNLIFKGADTAFVSCMQRVYRSVDGGENWEVFTSSIRSSEKDYSDITGLFLEDEFVFATTTKAALLKHSAALPDISLSQKKSIDTDISFFPNPVESGGMIYLGAGTKPENARQFTLRTTSGNLVYKGVTSHGQLPLPMLSSGIYLLGISAENKSETTYKIFVR